MPRVPSTRSRTSTSEEEVLTSIERASTTIARRSTTHSLPDPTNSRQEPANGRQQRVHDSFVIVNGRPQAADARPRSGLACGASGPGHFGIVDAKTADGDERILTGAESQQAVTSCPATGAGRSLAGSERPGSVHGLGRAVTKVQRTGNELRLAVNERRRPGSRASGRSRRSYRS